MPSNHPPALDTDREIQRQYARLAGRYDRRWKGYIDSTLQKAYEALNPSGDERILDVACGTGALEEIILKKHPNQRIVGLDLSTEMLTVAAGKRFFKKARPIVPEGCMGGARFLCADVSRLPFAAGSFDIVVCCSAFHYFREPSTALAECHRVLNAEGRLIIIDWCRDYLACRLFDIVLKTFDPAYSGCYRFDELQGILRGENFQIRSGTMFRPHTFWGMMCFEAVKG